MVEGTGGFHKCDARIHGPPAAANQSIPVLCKLQKWGDYASTGLPVGPTRFIPMKTPLSLSILASWSLPNPPGHSLTVPALLEEQSQQGCCIGLVIDLCNHDCLYTEDVPATLGYRHVRLVAKEIPSRAHVRHVAEIANRFWRERPLEFVAIHCAYGFNRTGFVVCSYLIEVLNFSVDQALKAFAISRTPGIKHEVFKRELRLRYEKGACPSRALGTGTPAPCGTSLPPGTSERRISDEAQQRDSGCTTGHLKTPFDSAQASIWLPPVVPEKLQAGDCSSQGGTIIDRSVELSSKLSDNDSLCVSQQSMGLPQ